jgi:4-aminobutyrate aminotransferase
MAKDYPRLSTPPPGPRARAIIERDARVMSQNYRKDYPLVAERGFGPVVEDPDGNRYLDFAAGIAVVATGHSHPDVVAAIKAQADRFLHMCATDFYYEGVVALAEALARHAPGPGPWRVFFANSGAEVVEGAVKLARLRTGRQKIVACYGAFHGRTYGAMSLTASKPVQRKGYGPLLPEVLHTHYAYCYRCPVNRDPATCDVECLDLLTKTMFGTTVDPEEVAAVIVEPVQGEGGFIAPPPGWLERIADMCRRLDIPFVADEVQSGFGRTGTLFATEQHPGVVPDFTLSAKSIAAGLPLAAVTGRAELMDAPGPGGLGGTYGGNPLACVAALATIELFEQGDLLERARRMGETLGRRLHELAEGHRLVGEVRGLGAMMAMELVTDRETREPARQAATEVVATAARQGLLTLKAGIHDNVVRVLAPLVMEEQLLLEGLDILDRALAEATV